MSEQAIHDRARELDPEAFDAIADIGNVEMEGRRIAAIDAARQEAETAVEPQPYQVQLKIVQSGIDGGGRGTLVITDFDAPGGGVPILQISMLEVQANTTDALKTAAREFLTKAIELL
jgi:hypothetical protein